MYAASDGDILGVGVINLLMSAAVLSEVMSSVLFPSGVLDRLCLANCHAKIQELVLWIPVIPLL